jgi:hypothetical protein
MGPNGVYVCPPTIVTASPLDPFDLPNSSNNGNGAATPGFPSIPPPVGVPIFVGDHTAPVNPGLYVTPGPPSDLFVREQARPPWRILDGDAQPAFTRDKTLVVYSLIGNTYFGSGKSDTSVGQLSVWNSTPDSLEAFAYESRLTDALPTERPAVHVSSDVVQTTPINKDKLVAKIDSIATKTDKYHICAKHCRFAFEAAGMNTAGHPVDAKDYGPFLLSHGATKIAMDDQYQEQKGDVIVFEGTNRHPHGHIEIFDGSVWVSDFIQHGLSPYPLSETPSFQIFRFRDQLEVPRP